MSHEDILAYYKLEEETVRAYGQEALDTGDASWFVRSATDRYLGYKELGELPVQDWAIFGLRSLKQAITKLENISTSAKTRLQQDEKLDDQEETRLFRLLDLLEQRFMLIHNSLNAADTSNVGIQELIDVANEGDILCLRPGKNLRQRYLTLNETEPKHKCFKYIAKAVTKRLSKWEHPIRVEIALRTMLTVIPNLGHAVFMTMSIDPWGHTLVYHGLADAGEHLAIAVNGRLSLLLGASPSETAGL